MFKVIHNVYGGIRMDKKQKITLNDELVKKDILKALLENQLITVEVYSCMVKEVEKNEKNQ